MSSMGRTFIKDRVSARKAKRGADHIRITELAALVEQLAQALEDASPDHQLASNARQYLLQTNLINQD
ncbi:hypothetical protein [Noviherbaspirillum pedocola]|uniref:Uncharacterized protein n=1 Tax=Noviherbaspirillum pedocola TaxID=2801341 RepID=A0A934SUT5_9BURK|nr:hypothetical protein [Noviherbaspirillum pedocola]MBK4736117.1 hypothetical protein [Noviherbaspirillum pedocola]